MSKELLQLATNLSESFMPAEQAQGTAASKAAESLVLARKLRETPAFRGGIGDPALEALARATALSIQADLALREAHREFARMLPRSLLSDLDWGCTSPECPPIRGTNVRHIAAAA
jgi:hypothetical protein